MRESPTRISADEGEANETRPRVTGGVITPAKAHPTTAEVVVSLRWLENQPTRNVHALRTGDAGWWVERAGAGWWVERAGAGI